MINLRTIRYDELFLTNSNRTQLVHFFPDTNHVIFSKEFVVMQVTFQ